MTIGNLVTSIPGISFWGGTALRFVEIPTSVTSIGDWAFNGCTGLSTIVIPGAVINIGKSAFEDCTALSAIVMGNNVKYIGKKAFNNCLNSDIYITTQVPPTADESTFRDYSGRLHLQGQETVTAYRNATPCWNNFGSIEVMVEPTKISTNSSTISGKAGDTFQLTATVLPEDVTLPYIFWRSTNPKIATVDNHGLVTFNSDATTGTCKIIAETLYANGPVAEVIVTDIPSGVEDVFDDSFSSDEIDFNAPVEVYNLHGVMVGRDTNHLATGIYVVRQGKNVKKIIVG